MKIKLKTQFIMELDADRKIVIYIRKSRNSYVSHYAHTELWQDGEMAISSETGYLIFCYGCIAAREANRLDLGIRFVSDDFLGCTCDWR